MSDGFERLHRQEGMKILVDVGNAKALGLVTVSPDIDLDLDAVRDRAGTPVAGRSGFVMFR